MYRSLDPEQIVWTIDRLHRRIGVRFPGSGLSGVAGELLQVARVTRSRIVAISRPHYPLRIGVWILILAIIAIIAVVAMNIREVGPTTDTLALEDVITLAEAATNELVLIGALIFFLVTLERRWRRNQMLRSIHELRSLAHVVDMHQLTKDPLHLAEPDAPAATPAATLAALPARPPEPSLTAFELSFYLDYCSELSSLIAKIAALYLGRSDDALVIASANDVEELSTGLSRKVWQKMMILSAAHGGTEPPSPRGTGAGGPAG